ncbi:hypothetical protein FISHEDRAFT_69741 [Fistulina hepatica ATCC 64428]|uniref:Uncharacterized protein n=1 Tax=Fistulina hepatica ATCC 64428 TaxID=1128425 RepID=A0A0D7AMK7_9AGAR|nr:hypothetical protein FISHEDRAFT_69741 [Fistulina hepatica ATCC 64428]
MLFSLAQIIVVYCHVNDITINYVVLVNINVAVLGVVFATVWTSTSRYGSSLKSDASSTLPGGSAEPALSAIRFHMRTSQSVARDNQTELSQLDTRGSDMPRVGKAIRISEKMENTSAEEQTGGESV